MIGGSGIDSKEPIPPAYVAWRADMITHFVVPIRQAAQPGGIDSFKLIPGLFKRFYIGALGSTIYPSWYLNDDIYIMVLRGYLLHIWPHLMFFIQCSVLYCMHSNAAYSVGKRKLWRLNLWLNCFRKLDSWQFLIMSSFPNYQYCFVVLIENLLVSISIPLLNTYTLSLFKSPAFLLIIYGTGKAYSRSIAG
jgi:hypothetical protein